MITVIKCRKIAITGKNLKTKSYTFKVDSLRELGRLTKIFYNRLFTYGIM